MPSWPIHVALANKFNKKFKNKSHFRVNGRINYDLFLKDYGDKLDNPIVFGYFVHLLVDKFYNMHTAKDHFVDGGVLLSNGVILDKDEKTLFMKQSEYNQYGHVLFENNLLGSKVNFNNKSLENIRIIFSYEKTKYRPKSLKY